LREMESRGITPNTISYSAAISACEKEGQWQQALILLREMESRGISPGTISYNAAISACEKGGQWQRALALLREMESRGIVPDTISYSAAISACEKGRQWQQALELLREMESHGVLPNLISYSAVVKCCFDCQEFGIALRIVHEAQRKKCLPRFWEQEANEWDLHGLSLATAAMLVTDALLMIAQTRSYELSHFQEIMVITGRGKRSGQDGPVLQQQLPLFLETACGPVITPVAENPGCFLFQKDTLKQWAASEHFKSFQRFVTKTAS